MDGVSELENRLSGDCDKKQKYNFRRSSVIKRIRVEENQKLSKRQVKAKTKEKPEVQPLSKYRRKSANARERSRINDMNLAYEQLRKVLPVMSTTYNKNKLSKQTILTLALNYISALRRVLGYPDHRYRSHDTSSTVSSDSELSTSSTGANSDVMLSSTSLPTSHVIFRPVSSSDSDDMCSTSSMSNDDALSSSSLAVDEILDNTSPVSDPDVLINCVPLLSDSELCTASSSTDEMMSAISDKFVSSALIDSSDE